MIVFSFVAVLVLLHPFQRFRRKTQLFEFSFFFPSANLCQLTAANEEANVQKT